MSTPAARILLIGGHGKVSLKLTPLLLSHSHHVTSLIRDPAQKSEILKFGEKSSGKVDVVIESLEDVKTESDAKRILDHVKPQWVVWSAGAGGKGGAERTLAIDKTACIAFIRAAIATPSISKFLLVSTLLTRRNKASWWSEEEWKEVRRYFTQVMPTYCEAKLAADESLSVLGTEREEKDEGFRWVCLRPGTLNDDDGKGKVELGKTKARGKISREDVADVAMRLLEGGANGWVDLLEGEEDVGKAVERIIGEKVDAIEGEDLKVMRKNME